MAMTPGGRAPSAPPPPRPSQSPRSLRPPTVSTKAAQASVARWGCLIGGLVIIADLGTRAVQQRTDSPEIVGVLDTANLVLNAVLFSIAGASVVRETGAVRLAALAGLLAGVIDGIVVAAADAMAPQASSPPEVLLMDVLLNACLGTLLAAASAWFTRVSQRRGGP